MCWYDDASGSTGLLTVSVAGCLGYDVLANR